MSIERIVRHIPQIERTRSERVSDTSGGEALGSGRQRFGVGDLGHVVEVFVPGFDNVERRGHVKDRPTVLDRHDSSCGERSSITDSIHFVQDRDRRVTRTQEVGMERVDWPLVVDGPGGGHECLSGDLAAEDSLPVFVGVHAPEDVDLDGFEVEKIDECVDLGLVHVSMMASGMPVASSSVQLHSGGVHSRMTAVASTSVTSTLGTARTFMVENREKIIRYCGVSVVNVLVGQGILAFCLLVLDLSGVLSQFIAASLSAIPAYILSRRWVWKQRGKDSFRTEVLPFWTMAIIGLVFAVASIAIMERFTDHPIVIMLTSLGAYGVVWVGKYFVLDKIMWRVPADPEPTSAN